MWKRSKQIGSTAKGQDILSTVVYEACLHISIGEKHEKTHIESIVTIAVKRVGSNPLLTYILCKIGKQEQLLKEKS